MWDWRYNLDLAIKYSTRIHLLCHVALILSAFVLLLWEFDLISLAQSLYASLIRMSAK